MGVWGLVGAWVLVSALSAPPNVVLIFVDDLGTTDLGCYGSKEIATPAVDSLARDGVRFTNAYAASSVCSPSRASLLTGRHPVRCGVPGNVSVTPGTIGLPSEERTIAELLKPAGYTTGLVGKWHLGLTPETLPNGQGFDTFFGFQNGCIHYYNHYFTYIPDARHDLWQNEKEVFEEGKYFLDLCASEATNFVRKNARKPFFLYLALNAPHYPMHAPDRFFQQYQHLSGERQAYAALVAAMDACIATVLQSLVDTGVAERTLVIFASDHGPSDEKRAGGGGGTNGNLRGMKASLYEGGLRVPFIVKFPGVVPSGEARDQVVSLLDVFPTIADLVNVPIPSEPPLDGKSLKEVLLDGKAPATHETLVWQLGSRWAVRSGKWKLVIPDRDAAAELYDLSTDPSEQNDLAAQRPELVEKLTGIHAAELGPR